MRTLNILSIAILFIVITSCTIPDEPIDNRQLFPSQIGNYWIYERQDLTKDGDPIGKPFYDSLVIIDSKVIDDKQAFQVKFFRENIDTSTAYISAENSKIDLFSKNLNPFFKFDCECETIQRWKSLNLPSKSQWDFQCIDSNKIVNYSQTASIINLSTQKLTSDVFVYKRNSYQVTKLKSVGNRILKLILPEAGTFKVNPDFKYIDNRTVIEYEFDLQLSFADKIGISKIESTLQHGLKVSKSTSNLVRFQLK